MKSFFDYMGVILQVMGYWTNYNIFIKAQLIQSIGEGFFERLAACIALSFFDMLSFIAISIGNIVQSEEMVGWGYEVAVMGDSNVRGTTLLIIGLAMTIFSRFIEEKNSNTPAS